MDGSFAELGAARLLCPSQPGSLSKCSGRSAAMATWRTPRTIQRHAIHDTRSQVLLFMVSHLTPPPAPPWRGAAPIGSLPSWAGSGVGFPTADSGKDSTPLTNRAHRDS